MQRFNIVTALGASGASQPLPLPAGRVLRLHNRKERDDAEGGDRDSENKLSRRLFDEPDYSAAAITEPNPHYRP